MADPSAIVVASQFGDEANAAIASLVPGVRIRPVPLGYQAPDILDADVFLHIPDVRAERGGSSERPAGWPGRLRLVQVISTGTDFYPDWLFAGPAVTTAQGLAGPAISEYCLAAIFAAARDMPRIWMAGPQDWRRLQCQQVSGSTLGLFGFGSIGSTLARKALALGMRVAAVRRSREPLGIDGVEQLDQLGDLLARCDHVVLAAPGTAETRHVVNRETLAMARPGLHLVNVARGGLIDDDALLASLDNGTVGRATLDVTEPEPLPAGHRFYTHPRVFLSPHIANSGPAFLAAISRRAADNIKRLEAGGELVGVSAARV